MKRAAIVFATIASLFSALAAPRAASATNHITRLDQVMIGAFGRKDIQYVVMSHSGCDQTLWGPLGVGQPSQAGLFFFNASNVLVGQFLFPSNPTCNSGSVLIGTQAFKDLASAPDPDFVMPVLGVPGGGKVCFEDNPASPFAFDVALCLSYGNFTGDSEQASASNAVTLPLQDVCTLKRNGLMNFGAPNRNEDFGLLPPAPKNTAGTTGPVTVPPRFGDVPDTSPFRRFIEAMFNSGVTSGCGGGNYCPDAVVNREQMAIFMLLAKEGPTFSPPACTVPTFADVPCSSPFARWIEELVRRGVTSGCGGGNYCPKAEVTRAQMAVFLLVAKEGAGFSPPACTTPSFADVPCSSPFAKWIEELVRRGVTSGCGGGNYCPANAVTRGQMAVFLSATFGLPVPVAPANSACPAPMPGVCAHSKCVTGVALNVNDCDSCVGQICAADSFCCNNSWDSACVGEVASICHQTCP